MVPDRARVRTLISFSSKITNRPNKLLFHYATLKRVRNKHNSFLSHNYEENEVASRAHPSGLASIFTLKYDKRSSLYCPFVDDNEKKFYTIDSQCGHAFHVACLERAGCLVFVAGTSESGDASKPVNERWQCYSCVTKNLVRVLTSSTEADVASSERHSATPESVTHTAVVEEITNRRVSRAKDFLSRYKSPPSYLAVVDSMSHPVSSSSKVSDFEVTRHTSVFDLPTFSLKLAPDPPESHC
jgi:hypothetical protein